MTTAFIFLSSLLIVSNINAQVYPPPTDRDALLPTDVSAIKSRIFRKDQYTHEQLVSLYSNQKFLNFSLRESNLPESKQDQIIANFENVSSQIFSQNEINQMEHHRLSLYQKATLNKKSIHVLFDQQSMVATLGTFEFKFKLDNEKQNQTYIKQIMLDKEGRLVLPFHSVSKLQKKADH